MGTISLTQGSCFLVVRQKFMMVTISLKNSSFIIFRLYVIDSSITIFPGYNWPGIPLPVSVDFRRTTIGLVDDDFASNWSVLSAERLWYDSTPTSNDIVTMWSSMIFESLTSDRSTWSNLANGPKNLAINFSALHQVTLCNRLIRQSTRSDCQVVNLLDNC